MSSSTEIVGVIPARLGSTRLPRKVLREIRGRPMVQHVFERAQRCKRLTKLVVATDSDEVADVCQRRDIPVEMTSPLHPSGTDRLFEVITHHSGDIFVNIQGDEPLIDPAHLDALLTPFEEHAGTEVSTLRIAITTEEARNPNVVKVVCDESGHALYFSRWPIPFDRDEKGRAPYYKHVGLYAYRRRALEQFHGWLPSKLEVSERLEQLRYLEHGVRIFVAETTVPTVGVDTEEDLRAVEEILRRCEAA